MPMNHDLIGFTGKPTEFTVDGAQLEGYAEATSNPNPVHRGPDAVAPPCFAFSYGLPAMGKCLFQPKLNANIMRLVHGEQTFRLFRLVRGGDRLTSTAKIVSIEDKPTGETITISITTVDQNGAVVCESQPVFFIRGSGSGAKKDAVPEAAPAGWDHTVPVSVTADQATRFGNASGDKNPIHMNGDAARASGLKGVILQGLCTLNFAATAVVDSCLKGDPAKLAEFSVRFSKMVYPGDTLTTRIRRVNGGCEFDVVNQAGEQVLKNGAARFTPA